MKFTLALFGFLALAAVSYAEDLAPFDRLGKGNVTVKAKQLSGGSRIDRNWQTSYGSYDRDTTSFKIIEVEVSGRGQSQSPLRVEFFFAMRDPDKGVRYFEGQEEASNATKGLYTFSTSVTRNDQRYVFLGERYKSGDKPVGWLVRVIRDNAIVGIAASAPSYEKVAGSPGELDAGRVTAGNFQR